MSEATAKLDELAANLQQAFNQLEQAAEVDEINETISRINQLVSALDGLARQLGQQLSADNQVEIVPLLEKIAEITNQSLDHSKQQHELAKQGLLQLRKTEAGVSAYHQIKKIR